MEINQLNKHWLNFFIIVLLANSVIDSLIMMYDNRTIIILVQYGMNIAYLTVFLNFKGRLTNYHIYKILFLIVAYFFFLSFFSSDYRITFNYLAKFLIPFLFFIVGYKIINTPEDFLSFAKKSLIILIYFVTYIVYANVFSFGGSLYGGPLASFKTGYIGLQALYIPTFLIILTLFLLPFYNKKTWIILLSGLGIIIFLLILKRTNLLLLAIGLVLWLYFERKINTKYGVLFLIVLGVSIYFVSTSDILDERISVRSSIFSSEYSITQEGRFKENIFIWDQINDSPITLFFGSGEVFNDRETMSEEADFVGSRGRQTHNSYARLLWNGGLLGLFLFLFLYIKFWRELRIYYKNYESQPVYGVLYHLAITFIIIRLINEFSSGITYLTFNVFFYFTIGALIRVGYNKHKQTLVNYANKIFQNCSY